MEINNDYKKIIEQAKRERGLIIYVVDLFAFEGSIVQSLINQLKDTRLLVIASKRDVIPSSVKDTKLINFVKERLNDKLEIEGVVFTMYDARTNLSLQVVENVKNNLNQTVYKTIIPRNVRLAEAPSHGLPINL